MNISMAIADLNKEYLYRLTEILQQNRELNISVFTSLENLQEAMEKTRFDVLLFDPDISSERIGLSGVKLAVCLYSDECRNIDNYRDCQKVLKYQRVSNIYKFVLHFIYKISLLTYLILSFFFSNSIDILAIIRTIAISTKKLTRWFLSSFPFSSLFFISSCCLFSCSTFSCSLLVFCMS